MTIGSATILALASMPAQFEHLFRSLSRHYIDWKPQSWEGMPGETFTAIAQACHLRDIEIDGYQVRIRRMLEQDSPELVSIDGYALADERHYRDADADDVLAAFRCARSETIKLIQRIDESQMKREGYFEGYGHITLKGLVHFLCSHDQQHLACMQWLLGKMDSDSAFGSDPVRRSTQ